MGARVTAFKSPRWSHKYCIYISIFKQKNNCSYLLRFGGITSKRYMLVKAFDKDRVIASNKVISSGPAEPPLNRYMVVMAFEADRSIRLKWQTSLKKYMLLTGICDPPQKGLLAAIGESLLKMYTLLNGHLRRIERSASNSPIRLVRTIAKKVSCTLILSRRICGCSSNRRK